MTVRRKADQGSGQSSSSHALSTTDSHVLHTAQPQQQSPRFPCGPPAKGPPRELSPTLPGAPSNNNHPPHHPCSNCPPNERPTDCKHQCPINPMQRYSPYTNCEKPGLYTEDIKYSDTIKTENLRSCSEDKRSFNHVYSSFKSEVNISRNQLENVNRQNFESCQQNVYSDCSGKFENDSGFSPGFPDSEECFAGIKPKTEPGGFSPSGDDGTCAGCGQIIQDRFYLSAVERRWHAGCLQCCYCRQLLEGEASCYLKDGNIYCKTDYFRTFGTRECARCMASISPPELVMRARHLVYHVHCFTCAMCNAPLTKGDHFGIRNSAVFCRLHFELPVTHSPQYPPVFTPSFPSPPMASPSPVGDLPVKGPGFFPSGQTAPRQKGRPRKRKPKDLEGMTANLDLNSDYMDLGFGRSPGGHGMGGNSRSKRMRTSFKHHQLRTMKSYFAINHNPDAKDLKQLSQKTGLQKRVLQVWFQNARAKWRRLMMKQDGKGDKTDGSSLSLEGYNAHSPPFLLVEPASPNSID